MPSAAAKDKTAAADRARTGRTFGLRPPEPLVLSPKDQPAAICVGRVEWRSFGEVDDDAVPITHRGRSDRRPPPDSARFLCRWRPARASTLGLSTDHSPNATVRLREFSAPSGFS